jgi:hypothetical protein
MTARISLTMIVKNEAATLGRCLASVRDLVDEIIVVDTGSSDNTKDIARQYDAGIFDLPWPDSFAAARNESIRHASGQWLLWLDADEYFDDAQRSKLRQLISGDKRGDIQDSVGKRIGCGKGTGFGSGNSLRSPVVARGIKERSGPVRLHRGFPEETWDIQNFNENNPECPRFSAVTSSPAEAQSSSMQPASDTTGDVTF